MFERIRAIIKQNIIIIILEFNYYYHYHYKLEPTSSILKRTVLAGSRGFHKLRKLQVRWGEGGLGLEASPHLRTR